MRYFSSIDLNLSGLMPHFGLMSMSAGDSETNRSMAIFGDNRFTTAPHSAKYSSKVKHRKSAICPELSIFSSAVPFTTCSWWNFTTSTGNEDITSTVWSISRCYSPGKPSIKWVHCGMPYSCVSLMADTEVAAS